MDSAKSAQSQVTAISDTKQTQAWSEGEHAHVCDHTALSSMTRCHAAYTWRVPLTWRLGTSLIRNLSTGSAAYSTNAAASSAGNAHDSRLIQASMSGSGRSDCATSIGLLQVQADGSWSCRQSNTPAAAWLYPWPHECRSRTC